MRATPGKVIHSTESSIPLYNSAWVVLDRIFPSTKDLVTPAERLRSCLQMEECTVPPNTWWLPADRLHHQGKYNSCMGHNIHKVDSYFCRTSTPTYSECCTDPDSFVDSSWKEQGLAVYRWTHIRLSSTSRLQGNCRPSHNPLDRFLSDPAQRPDICPVWRDTSWLLAALTTRRRLQARWQSVEGPLLFIGWLLFPLLL
jgi:hypothetical protein